MTATLFHELSLQPSSSHKSTAVQYQYVVICSFLFVRHACMFFSAHVFCTSNAYSAPPLRRPVPPPPLPSPPARPPACPPGTILYLVFSAFPYSLLVSASRHQGVSYGSRGGKRRGCWRQHLPTDSRQVCTRIYTFAAVVYTSTN